MGCFMVHTQEGCVLHACTKFEWVSAIRSKVVRGPTISKLGHVTQATPTWRRFMVHVQEGCVLYVHVELEADSIIRSKVIRGFQNFEIGSRNPKPRTF